MIFLATGLTPGAARPEPTEDITVRTVPLAGALAMVESGEIHDAVTQLGLFAAVRALAS